MFSDIKPLLANTTPIVLDDAIRTISDLYERYVGKKVVVIRVDGPKHLQQHIKVKAWPHKPIDLFSKDGIAHFVTKRSISGGDSMRHAVVQAFRKSSSWPIDNLFAPKDYLYGDDYEFSRLASDFWRQAYMAVTFEEVCYVVQRPQLALYNDEGFHSTDGAALCFRDGTEIFAYHGTVVPNGKHVVFPNTMTLADVHRHRSSKYKIIDLYGVDRYIKDCARFKPCVCGKFQRFFDFARLEHADTKNFYSGDRKYVVRISRGRVNGKYSMILHDESNDHRVVLPYGKSNTKRLKLLLDKSDMELWQLLDLDELFSRTSLSEIVITYHENKYRLAVESKYERYGRAYHDIAPAWFKTKMWKKEDAFYESDLHKVEYKNGQLTVTGAKHQKHILGNHSLGEYEFDIDLQSDTWEGLLHKWADLSFKWLGMHGSGRYLGH